MTTGEALRRATAALRDGGIDGAARDARILLADVLGIAPDRVGLCLDEGFSPEQVAGLNTRVAARLARQPVSQIVGHRLFWGRRFQVTRSVLDPRPETETLVAAALEEAFKSVLDLGTGSGAILLTLLAERPDATGLGVDVSEPALRVARETCSEFGLSGRCTLVQSDWFANVEGTFDLIVSNPPYIGVEEMAELSPDVRDWEPHIALTPGGDGLDAFRAISAEVMGRLAIGGRLLVEIGPTQADRVAGLFEAAGLRYIEVRRDLAGRDRVVLGRRHRQ